MATHITFGALRAKENTGSLSPSKQMRKLKVELSDKLFQLRKLQEDYAEEKAHLHMSHNTEKNILNQIIKELKDKLAEENEHWTTKIDEIRNTHCHDLQKLNQEWSEKVQQELGVRAASMKEKYEKENSELISTVARLEAAIKNNKKRFDLEIYNIRQGYKRQISNLLDSKERSLAEQRKNMEKDEDLKINAIMHIKASEQKEHKKTKELLTRKQEQLEQYKAITELKVFEYRQQIWRLKKELSQISEQLLHKKTQLEELQRKNKTNIQMSLKDYEQKIAKIQQDWKSNIASLNEKWIGEYKKLQTAFEKNQAAMNEKERLWEQRGNKVFQMYTKRQARQEDVKLIQNLEVQLIKKQFQLEREKQQLKSAKMELDNMDDIYKRIFHSAHKGNRHSASFHLKKIKLPGILNRSSHPLKNTIDH